MSHKPQPSKLVIGSRGSMLALWQAHHIKRLLEELNPALVIEIRVIKTQGDVIKDVAFSKIGGKGLFTKELELALVKGEVDLCVHSMKDVPTTLPPGLMLGPVPQRAEAADALVASGGVTGLDELSVGARIGTGSLRRRAQLSALGRSIELVELRGNIDTRIRKVEEGLLDAVILAAAGICRLGWQHRIAAIIAPEIMTPAAGQGALALELREGDERTGELLAPLSHVATERCVLAERHIMRALDGGCQVPVGAHASYEAELCTVRAMVARPDGSKIVRAQTEGSTSEVPALAEAVVRELLAQGARELLDEARGQAGNTNSAAALER